MDSNKNIKLNFISSWRKFQNYSLLEFFDMVENQADLANFKNKIVIIGVSDPQIAKTINSNFDDELPGVALHAFAVENLLQDRSINYNYLDISKYLFILFLIAFSVLLLKSKNQLFVGLFLIIIFYTLYSYLKY